MPSRNALLASTTLLSLFTVLTVAVHLHLLRWLDLGFMYWLEGPDAPWLIDWATFTGIILSAQVSVVYALVAVAVLLWLRAGIWSLAPMAFLVGTAVETAMKIVIDQPAASLIPFLRESFYPFALINVGNSGGAFPSGHASRTGFVLASVVILLWHRGGPARWLAVVGYLVLAVAIAFSRIYIADHFLTDVVGGLMLGSAVALLAMTPAVARVMARRGAASAPLGGLDSTAIRR